MGKKRSSKYWNIVIGGVGGGWGRVGAAVKNVHWGTYRFRYQMKGTLKNFTTTEEKVHYLTMSM